MLYTARAVQCNAGSWSTSCLNLRINEDFTDDIMAFNCENVHTCSVHQQGLHVPRISAYSCSHKWGKALEFNWFMLLSIHTVLLPRIGPASNLTWQTASAIFQVLMQVSTLPSWPWWLTLAFAEINISKSDWKSCAAYSNAVVPQTARTKIIFEWMRLIQYDT